MLGFKLNHVSKSPQFIAPSHRLNLNQDFVSMEPLEILQWNLNQNTTRVPNRHLQNGDDFVGLFGISRTAHCDDVHMPQWYQKPKFEVVWKLLLERFQNPNITITDTITVSEQPRVTPSLSVFGKPALLVELYTSQEGKLLELKLL